MIRTIEWPYKHFYPGAQEEGGKVREEIRKELGAGSGLPGSLATGKRLPPGNSLPAPSSGETALKLPAGQKLLHRAHHNRAQGTRAELETLLVSLDATVKVILEQLVDNRFLRMFGSIGRPRLANC